MPRSTLWTVQVREGETWTTPHEGTRFVDAVTEYNERSGVRRLLLNGVPLSMEGDHPDLFTTTPTTQHKQSALGPSKG